MKAQRFFWPLYPRPGARRGARGQRGDRLVHRAVVARARHAADRSGTRARRRLQRLVAARPATIVRASRGRALSLHPGRRQLPRRRLPAGAAVGLRRAAPGRGWPDRRGGDQFRRLGDGTAPLLLSHQERRPGIEAGRHRAGRLCRQRFRLDTLRRLDAAADRRAAAALPARRPGAAHDLARRQPPRPLGVRPQQQDHRRRIRPAQRMAQAAGGSAARPDRAAPQAELLSPPERRGDPRDPVARRRQVLDGLRQAAPGSGIPRGLAAVGHDRLGDRHLDHAAHCRGGRPPRRHARWSTRR